MWYTFSKLIETQVQRNTDERMGWCITDIPFPLRLLVGRTPVKLFVVNELCSYACFIDVNCWTVATEIFPSHLRAQGTGISIATLMLTDLLWLQLAPTAQTTIGWKYYLVFLCLTAVHIVYFWFRLPEV